MLIVGLGVWKRFVLNVGAKAQAAAPLKWSPEDHRANVRRQLNNVESPDWAQTIPTLPSVEEMRIGSQQQEEE